MLGKNHFGNSWNFCVSGTKEFFDWTNGRTSLTVYSRSGRCVVEEKKLWRPKPKQKGEKINFQKKKFFLLFSVCYILTGHFRPHVYFMADQTDNKKKGSRRIYVRIFNRRSWWNMSISTYRRPRISFNCAHFKLPALFKKKKRSSTFSNDKWFQVLAIKQDRWREPICIRCKLKNKEIYYNFLNVKITPCMPSYIYILKCFLLYIFLVSVCLCIRVEEDERIE